MEKCDCEDDEAEMGPQMMRVSDEVEAPVDEDDCMAVALAAGKIPSRECCAGYMTIPLESHPCKRYL